MSDYMDAQCNGVEHADKLATSRQVQSCVGEDTMMGFQQVCLASTESYPLAHEREREKKKKVVHLQ